MPLLNIVVPFCDFDYVAIAVDDFFVVLADVREHAAAAVFETAFGVFEIAAAVFT